MMAELGEEASMTTPHILRKKIGFESRERLDLHTNPYRPIACAINAANEQRIRDRLAAIATERQALEKVFVAEYPDYATLSTPSR